MCAFVDSVGCLSEDQIDPQFDVFRCEVASIRSDESIIGS